MAGYTGGRIKHINIRNFMTYDDVEIIPKKGLNLIVGLNGSGKSSIMCAICLGLAGKPRFTGRASQLFDFIKHGQQEAEIEIELESVGHKNVVICRKIKKQKCEWFLNKKSSNVNEVADVVKEFNIDTSNLCQFLPQEKVVEFSRMDKKQRLENMLQTIGEPHLFEQFNELKDLHKSCFDIENSIKKVEQSKSSAAEENERISDEVRNQEYRVRLKNELNELFKLKTLLQYKEKRDEIQALKAKKSKLEKDLKVALEEEKAALQAEEYFLSNYKDEAEERNKLKSCVEDLVNELNRKYGLITNLNEQVDNAKIEYKNRIAEKETQKKRLQDINTQIDALQILLEKENANKQTNSEKLKSNSQELSNLQQDISNLYKNIENVNENGNSLRNSIQKYEKDLSALKDEHSKKLTILRKYDKYTYEAVLWLNENKDQFKSKICLPIILEVNVQFSQYCKYLENHIAFRDMIAFICEDKEDCKHLTEILKIQKKLPVNIVMAPNTPLSAFRSPMLSRDFKMWGLQYFLIDLFSAPEPVMCYLCSCYNVHNIPVSVSHIDADKIERILHRFTIFYAGNMKISGRKSRYGDRNWSVKKDFLSNRNLLINHDDTALRELEHKLQLMKTELHKENVKFENLKSQFSSKEKVQEKLRQEKKYLLDHQKKISDITSSLTIKKKYREQTSVLIDDEEERAKVTQKVQSVNKEKEKIFQKICKLFKDIYCMQKKVVCQTLCMNCLSKELKMTKAGNEDIHDKVKTLQGKYSELEHTITLKRIPAKQLYEEIKKKGVPSSIQDLERGSDETEMKISHIQAQLNLNEDNESIIKEYYARQEEIQAFQDNIHEKINMLEEKKATLEKIRKKWLQPLEYHISNINKRFSRYFKRLSCAGEISLDIPDNVNDFANYGLQIKLKFHDDQPLIELSQMHHSGGECSVAAIVFILSLQDLTEVPFRCIDEINQGMDSIYERKVYNLIAESVNNDSCSQYFLLTPKLLMDLHYPDDAAIHVIYNTSYMNAKLDIKALLKSAKNMLL